jgi:hypothetical protein
MSEGWKIIRDFDWDGSCERDRKRKTITSVFCKCGEWANDDNPSPCCETDTQAQRNIWHAYSIFGVKESSIITCKTCNSRLKIRQRDKSDF